MRFFEANFEITPLVVYQLDLDLERWHTRRPWKSTSSTINESDRTLDKSRGRGRMLREGRKQGERKERRAR